MFIYDQLMRFWNTKVGHNEKLPPENFYEINLISPRKARDSGRALFGNIISNYLPLCSPACRLHYDNAEITDTYKTV